MRTGALEKGGSTPETRWISAIAVEKPDRCPAYTAG